MNDKRGWSIILASLLSLVWIASTSSQAEGGLTLRLSRDFGYSSGTGRIQGRFTLKALGPDDLAKVVFLIDGQAMGEDNTAPYELQFHTGDYPQSIHTLAAIGITADGRQMQSNEYRLEFVGAEEGLQTALKIALPILGVALAATLFPIIFPMLTGRKQKASLQAGAAPSYGIFGGAICPKCSRPFSIHIWGINLLVGRLDRCPYCGGWSVVQRASRHALENAESAHSLSLEGDKTRSQPSPEDQLKRALEESRYSDL